MTTGGEQSPAEAREAELAKVFKRMGKAARRGDAARYEELRAEHGRLKAEHVVLSHEERRAEARARRAAVRAQEAAVGPARWRLPRGFASPLAAERARTGWRERREPRHPGYGLRPWREVAPGERQIWRP